MDALNTQNRQRQSAKAEYYLNTIVPNVPAKLLSGPEVKNSRFLPPFRPRPSPKSIPQSWSIRITLPVVSLTAPTNCPVMALKPLMLPVFVLFETSSVLLSGPKLLGAAAKPQGWFSGGPWARSFKNVPFSVKISMKPPAAPDVLANAT